MTRRAEMSFPCILLALALASPSAIEAQSATAITGSARRKAIEQTEAPPAANQKSISTLVDERLDQRVDADVQSRLQDPRLLGLNRDSSDATPEDTSASAASEAVILRRRIAGATSWSPLQPILSPAPTEPLAASFEDSVPPPAVLPVAGGGADAGGDLSAESAHDLREPGGSVQPKSQLSRLQIQKTKRAKREAREVQRKSVQQCEQLHSDQAECRLQLDRAATGSDRHGQPLPKLSTSAR